jgi:hypothetical protein
MDQNKELCDYCGDYENKGTGKVMVECCSNCNTLHCVGICEVCEGTGYILNPHLNNVAMIRRAIPSNGYICGYDPRGGW